jgi:type II secretory pathway pseudopilin PulG
MKCIIAGKTKLSLAEPRQGMSMVEIVVALAIMIIAALPILTLMNSSHSDTRSTMEEVMASNLASEIIESFQSMPVEFIPVGFDGPIDDSAFAAAENAGYKFPLATAPLDFDINLKISQLNLDSDIPANSAADVAQKAASAAKIIRIEARIEWESKGRQRKLQLVTAKSRL